MLRKPILHVAATVLLLASTRSAGAAIGDTTGQSWKDPALGEILRTADLVAEVKVFVGGQASAWVDVMKIFRGSASSPIHITGFNSYEWNTAYHTMREGETYIVALYRVGNTYCLATPSSARFPLDGSKVIGRFGSGDFLVEIPGDDFREALRAFYASDPVNAAKSLRSLLNTGSIETRYLTIVLLGELASHARTAVSEALAALVSVADDENSAIREAAAQSLGKIGGVEAATALRRLLTDADRSVARTAAVAVCETSSHGAGAQLVAWLERAAAFTDSRPTKPSTDSLKAQGRVLQFLADGDWIKGVGPKERQAVIRGMLEVVASAKPARARIAAHVLGRMGAKEAIEPLARLLDTDDYALRQEATGALTMITLSPTAYTSSEFAKWWQENRNGSRRKWIAEGLLLAQKSLERDSYDGDSLARALLAIAKDPIGPWVVRKKAAEGTGWEAMPLAEIGGPLVAAFVESEFASSLTSRRTRASKTISDIVDDFPAATRIFMPSLMLACSDPDSDVRESAILAFETIDPSRLSSTSLQTLIGFLVDNIARGPDSTSRDESARVLRHITGRYHGFYESRGYEFAEEFSATERWKDWWGEVSRVGWTPVVRPVRSAAMPSDTSPVLLRLADDNPETWLGAASQLVSSGDKGRASLRKAAKAPTPRLRAIAAALIGMCRGPNSAATLESLLTDSEPMVRLQAAWAIGNCLRGTQTPPPELLAMATKSPPAPVDPWGRPPADLPPSIVGMDDNIPVTTRPLGAIQTQALIALGKIGGAQAVDLLRKTGLEASSRIAAMATFALSLSPDARADTAIMKILTDTDTSRARDLAARAVAHRNPEGGVKALLEATRQIERWDAFPLMNALGRIIRREDASTVAPFIDTDSEALAVTTTYALARNPGPEALEGLLKVVDEGVSTARYYSIQAIGKLGEKRLLTHAMRISASEKLAGRFDDFDATVSMAVAKALEYMGTSDAGRPVMLYLNGMIPPDTRAFAPAVKLAGAEGLAFVLDQLRNESWGSRYYGLRALRYSPAPRAISILIERWRDDESPYQDVVEASLIESGPRAVRALATIIRSGKPYERRRAAMLLGRIAAPEAATILRRAAASTDANLARAAELALKLRPARLRPIPR